MWNLLVVGDDWLESITEICSSSLRKLFRLQEDITAYVYLLEDFNANNVEQLSSTIFNNFGTVKKLVNAAISRQKLIDSGTCER